MDDQKYIEQYLFLRLSQHDIQQAIQTLSILKRYKRKEVRYALLRDFAVTYSRPFSGSYGKVITNHKLQIKYVPIDQRDVHREIVKTRHQLFAHNELKHRDPKLANWSTPAKPWFPMSLKGFDYNKLDEKYADLLALAEIVLTNLNDEIAKRDSHLSSYAKQMTSKSASE